MYAQVHKPLLMSGLNSKDRLTFIAILDENHQNTYHFLSFGVL